MAIEPGRSGRRKLLQPAIGHEFDGIRQVEAREFDRVREVEARTRSFLARLVASSGALVTVVAAGYALITGHHEMLVLAWSIAGPLLGGVMGYYFAPRHLEEAAQASILQRSPEVMTQPGDAASVQVPMGVELDLQYSLMRERRLNPFVWSMVAVLIGAASTISIGALSPARPTPLLLCLVFLALLALAMIAFLWFDQRIRRQALLRNAYP
jgi:hypothetical protein